ncbi:MAG: MFS transporter [Proteobacteria bacterium]|nr:MFS transporter [Pseudomonadota bacterium]NOG59721.1 MFS transporter [Pseudomonadota bacterium]
MIKVDGLPYWRLSGFYFLFFLTIGAFMPYWSLYLKSIGMNAEAIGILSAIVVVTKIFSSFIWGWIVDHTGRRIQVIRYTSLLSMLSFSLVLFYQDFWSLFIILFIFSIFWSAALPQIEGVTLSHLGEESDSYTVVRIWGSISFIIAVLALGQFFDQHAIAYLLPIIIISMLLVWLHSLSLPEMSATHEDSGGASFRSILFKRHVIVLMIVCFLVQAGHGPYYTFFSIYLEEHQYSNSFIGTAWALGVLAEVFIYVFMHRVIGRFGLRKLMILVLVLASARWLLIALFVENVFILLFAQCLHAATFGIYHAVAIQYVHREFKGEHQGRGQALYSSVSFGAGLALGSLVSGYLWDFAGSMQTFIFAAILSAVGVIIAWYGLEN